MQRKKIKTSKQYKEEQEQKLRQIEQQQKQDDEKAKRKYNVQSQQQKKPNARPSRKDVQQQQIKTNNFMNNSGQLQQQQQQNDESIDKKQKQIDQQQQQQEQDEDQLATTLKRNQIGGLNNNNNGINGLDKTVGGSAGDMAKKLKEQKEKLFQRQNQNQNQQGTIFNSAGSEQLIQTDGSPSLRIIEPSNEMASSLQRRQDDVNSSPKSRDQNYMDRSGFQDSRLSTISQVTQQRKFSNTSQFNLLGGERQSVHEMKKRQIEEREIRLQQQLEEKKRKKQEALERRQEKTKMQKLVVIQSGFRMFIAKQKLKRLKRKFFLLTKENKTNNEIREFEQQCVDNYFAERDKVFISQKFSQTFTQPQGPNTLASLGELRHNTFYPTVFKALAEQGNLDILVEEKESEAEFNSQMKNQNKQQKQKKVMLSRPKTAESRSGFVHQYFQKPEQQADYKLKNGISQNYMQELKKDQKNSIISTFLSKNQPDTIKHAQQNAKSGFQNENLIKTEVQLKRNLNKTEQEMNQKIENLKSQLDHEHRVENKIEDSYYSDFEKDSQDFSQSLQQQNKHGNNNKSKPSPISQRKGSGGLNKSKQSIQESIISEEDYMKESFENDEMSRNSSQIRESISQGYASASHQKDSMRMTESIKIEEDYEQNTQQSVAESVIEESVIKEDFEMSKSKSINEGSIEEEDFNEYSDNYDNEKFESISEDVSTSQQQYKQSKSEDFQKSSQSFNKKKNVTFNSNNNNKQQQQFAPSNNNSQNQNQNQFQKQQQDPGSKYSNLQQNNENNGNGNDMQFDQFMKFQQFQQFIQNPEQFKQQNQENQDPNQQNQKIQKTPIEIPEGVNPEVQKIFEKYQPLKVFVDTEKESLTKEYMEIKKLETEIQQIMSKSKQISQKWQKEAKEAQDSNVGQKAEMLYTKFQCEFSNLLTTYTFGDKLKLLSNFTFYKELADIKAEKYTQPSQQQNGEKKEDNGEKLQKDYENRNVLTEMMQNLENKQEVIVTVLTQLMNNLSAIKDTSFDLQQVNQTRNNFEEKMQKMIDGQQKVMKKQFDEKIEKRDSEIKSLLTQILENQNKEKKEQQNKNKLRALLDLNRDPNQPKRKSSEEEYQDYLERKYEQNGQFRGTYNINQGGYDMGQWMNDQPRKGGYGGRKPDFGINDNNSSDIEANQDQSVISWQNDMILDTNNMTPQEKKIVQGQNTEQVVEFLTDMLMGEIQRDLFPLRQNTSQVFERRLSGEIIQKKSDTHWEQSPSSSKVASFGNNNNSPQPHHQKISSLDDPRSSNDSIDFESKKEKKSRFYEGYDDEEDKYNDSSIKKKSEESDYLEDKSDKLDKSKEKVFDRKVQGGKDEVEAWSPEREKKKKSGQSALIDINNHKKDQFSNKNNNENNQKQEKNQEEIDDQDKLIEESKQQTIFNQEIFKEAESISSKYCQILKKKSKKKALQKIIECLSQNENMAYPEFAGAAVRKVKIFDPKEIENPNKEQTVVHTLEEKFINIVVQKIDNYIENNNSYQQFNNSSKSQKQKIKNGFLVSNMEQIIESLLPKFDFMAEQAKKQVTGQAKKVVTLDCYDDEEKYPEIKDILEASKVKKNNSNNFEKVLDFCNKRQFPKEKDDADIGEEYLTLQQNADKQRFQGEVAEKITAQIFKDMADEFQGIMQKRKIMVQQQK